MKKHTLLGLFAAYTIVTASTCSKKFGCAESVYSFQGFATVLNAKDSISITDTVWLEIQAEVSQLDLNTNRLVSYSNAANLGVAIGFDEVVNPSNPVYAAKDFEYILKIGTSVENPKIEAIREYLFTESGPIYHFKLGLVPKRRGIFRIGISNANNVFRNDDKCTKAGYRITFRNTNQHLYFIRQVFGVEATPPPNGTYCFKVI